MSPNPIAQAALQRAFDSGRVHFRKVGEGFLIVFPDEQGFEDWFLAECGQIEATVRAKVAEEMRAAMRTSVSGGVIDFTRPRGAQG